jgi:hypothetical protein
MRGLPFFRPLCNSAPEAGPHPVCRRRACSRGGRAPPDARGAATVHATRDSIRSRSARRGRRRGRRAAVEVRVEPPGVQPRAAAPRALCARGPPRHRPRGRDARAGGDARIAAPPGEPLCPGSSPSGRTGAGQERLQDAVPTRCRLRTEPVMKRLAVRLRGCRSLLTCTPSSTLSGHSSETRSFPAPLPSHRARCDGPTSPNPPFPARRPRCNSACVGCCSASAAATFPRPPCLARLASPALPRPRRARAQPARDVSPPRQAL